MINNNWLKIWQKREAHFNEVKMNSDKDVFLELKRVDGFDVVGGGISYESLIKQHHDILNRLSSHKIESVFDVGCGCGANLYLFQKEGLKTGGIDYSSTLVKIAKNVLAPEKTLELICGEAISIPTQEKYDSIYSNSVFSYFPDEKYAESVLDKMLQKTKYSIGLIDVHDLSKKDAFIDFRRKNIENYDEKYKDLNKFFYSKEFFEKWADKNKLDLKFFDSQVEGYWNKDFVFDVYFYKS